MSKYFFIILGILFFSCKNEVKKPLVDSVLWEITSNDNNFKSYLFGSFHYIEKTKWNWDEKYTEKLKDCKSIFFETNYQEFKRLRKENPFMDLFENDFTYKEITDSSCYTKIINLLINEQHYDSLALDSLLRMKPLKLRRTIIEHKLGKLHKMDYYLLDKAQELKVQIKSLDNIFETINYTDEYNNMYLNYYCTNNFTFDTLINQHIINQEKYLNKSKNIVSKSEFDEYSLIAIRNNKWLPNIEESINKESCFFVIGASHLDGKLGLIELLRKKGFTVTPI